MINEFENGLSNAAMFVMRLQNSAVVALLGLNSVQCNLMLEQ